MKNLSTIDLTYENQLIKAEFMKDLSALYDSNLLMIGPTVERLEESIAHFCGTKHCCLTGSGTMALHVAAMALGIKPGDEVIVPANSFVASAVSMVHAGARIVLADVDPDTWNLSAATVRKVLTPRTKAICMVHLYGSPADPAEMAEFGLPVIEDASHAFGGALRGKQVGNLGDIAAFSAGPIKGFGGLGHAGIITYNQDEFKDYITGFVNNGQTARHYAKYVGHNFRIDNVNALFLQKKLSHWEHLLNRRKSVMRIYDEAFDGAQIRHQARLQNADPSLWVYVIRLDPAIRDQVMMYLKEHAGVDTLVQYTLTINQQPIWPQISACEAYVPTSEELVREILSLPIHSGIDPEDAMYISHKTIEAVEHCMQHA